MSARISSLTFTFAVVALGTGQLAVPVVAAPPNIPGVQVAAELGPVCPRLSPTLVDCNDDGIDDYVHASYHVGGLTSYMSPEMGASLGLFGIIATLKPVTSNKNFPFAGVVDGTTHELLWEFHAGKLISHFAVDLKKHRLYVGSHNDHIYAVELSSGKVVWERDLKGNPLGIDFTDELLVEVNARNEIAAHRLEDGSLAWSRPVKAAVMAHPNFGIMRADAEVVYVSSLDDHVYALEKSTGKQRWDFVSGGNPSLRLLVDGALLVADKKELVAVETATGAVRWRRATGGYVHGEPMVDIGGAVALFNGKRGKKAAFFAVDLATGEERWSVPLQKIARDKKRKIFLPEDTWMMKNALVVDRGPDGAVTVLYLADRTKVLAIRAEDGKTSWSAPMPGAQVLLRAGDRLVVADKEKVIHSLDAADGTVKWKHQQEAHIFQMEQLGAALLVTLYSADLAAFAFADGTPYGRHHLGEPYRLVPQEAGRLILCGQGASWLLEATEVGATAPARAQ